MELHTIGEFGLIDLISFPHPNPETVLVGIGDDCAVLPYSDTQYQLASCDLLVEDVHFIRGEITPYQLGYKAVAVNLSDIAAMGGTPTHILLSVAIPPEYTIAEWKAFYQGVEAICTHYGVNLIGGDTTASTDKLVINVSVIGLVEKQHLHLRKAAKEGDAVFVTGALGASRAGLELVLQKDLPVPDAMRSRLLCAHYQPKPCCDEIKQLNQIAGGHLHALNDISDGLVSECYEVADASDCALVLYRDAIPQNPDARILAAQIGADSLQWALTGGEDYQLLGTMDGTHAEEICAQYTALTGKTLTIIGFVTAGEGVYLLDGAFLEAKPHLPAEMYRIGKTGYNHFSDKIEAAAANEKEENDDVVQLLLGQITALNQQMEAQKCYRHDLKNHLAYVLGLLESGDIKAAQNYLQQLSGATPQQDVQYHGRTVLNILLNQKAARAKERNIEFQFECMSGADLPVWISDFDLCTLLGNLLDNGIEHVGGADPYLYLDLFANDAGNTVLRMENSCNTQPQLQDGIFVSCKADSSSHGKGMQQMQSVAEKNKGSFSWCFDAEGERFITQCVFEKE